MKFCIKCGEKLNDDDAFCAHCGAVLDRNRAEQTYQRSVHVDKAVKKKGNKAVVFILAAAIALVAASVVMIILMASDSPEKKYQKQLELAERYLDELDYEQAIAAYEAAIRIDSSRSEAYLGLAEIYREEKDYDMALEVLGDGITATKRSERRQLEKKREEIESAAGKKSGTAEQQVASSDGVTPVPTEPAVAEASATPPETPTETPAATSSPTPIPTEEAEPAASATPVPNPEPTEATAPESWREVDFSQILTFDNVLYVLERLVEEDGWEYGKDRHYVYKDSYIHNTTYVGRGRVRAITDPNPYARVNCCLDYDIPKHSGGIGNGGMIGSGLVSMEEAYNEIVAAIADQEEAVF